MKKIKTLLASLLVVLTIALAINLASEGQLSNIAARAVDPDAIDTYPLPYSLRKPTTTFTK